MDVEVESESIIMEDKIIDFVLFDNFLHNKTDYYC